MICWYDYGARFYEPSLAAFHTIDPLTEKFSFQSPYVYASNNPIRFIDFMGMNSKETNDDELNKKIQALKAELERLKALNAGMDKARSDLGLDWDDEENKENKSDKENSNSNNNKKNEGSEIEINVDDIVDDNVQPMYTGTPPVPGIGKVGSVVKLSKNGAKILRNLKNLKDISLADAIKMRGGTGSNVNKVATWLRGKPVGEVANEAAKGNAEAKTAIKIMKEAKRLSKK